jgi:hypothetical protein
MERLSQVADIDMVSVTPSRPTRFARSESVGSSSATG